MSDIEKWISKELKDCPFCGKSYPVVKLKKDETGFHQVVCSFLRSGCGGSSGYRQTVQEASELWNTRH